MNGYPRPDDVIFIQSEDVKKEYENAGWNGATAHVVTATFIKCDRPAHLMGVGEDEGAAVANLYQELRDHEQMVAMIGDWESKRTWYITQFRRKSSGWSQWFDDQHLRSETDEGRKAEVEAIRATPGLEDYEIRVIRRTEEVLDT